MAYQRRQSRSEPLAQQQPAPSVPDTRTGQIKPAMKSAQEWKDYFQKAEKQIRAAFPRLVKFEHVISCTLTAMHRQPRLFQCTPLSVMGAMIQSATLGLSFDPNLGEAYMVPYKNNKKAADGSWTAVNEAQLQVGYQGLMKLVRNSGNIGEIRAQCVYENDLFEYEDGTKITVHHTRWEMLKRKGKTEASGPGKLFAVYSVAETKDGAQSVKVMFVDEIEAIRKRSRAKDDGPWITDYEAMCKKTVIRQHCKMLPKSVELATAVTLDELHDANLPQGMDLIPFMAEDPSVAEELQQMREQGEKQAEAQAAAAQPAESQGSTLRDELLAKIQPHVDRLCAEKGIDAFDDLIVGVAHATKQKSQNVAEFTEDALVALLAKLEAVAPKESTDAVSAQS